MADDRIIKWIETGLLPKGKSQRGLARALNIDPSGVNRMLKGLRRPQVREIPLIASYIGIEPPNDIAALVDDDEGSPESELDRKFSELWGKLDDSTKVKTIKIMEILLSPEGE